MTSHLNVKNKRGLTELATIIRRAGFGDVEVTVQSKSITLTPALEVDLGKGLSDIKHGRYRSFESMSDAIKFLHSRTKKAKRSSVKTKR
jgi:hypothetical protein